MPHWLRSVLENSQYFMPHGHCYLWMPSLLWLHVVSDTLIGMAYLGISLVLYLLIRKIRLPFSPVFIAFGLFIGLCGLTHFLKVWTVWNPDYLMDGLVKAATAAASVATAIGLVFVRPQVEEVVHAARLSEERRIRLETTYAELEALYQKVKEMDELKTQFFANVSHELRTPLALILGPAESMLEDSHLTPVQKRQLEGISRNGKQLLRQVNDLLDIAKLEAGHMRVEYVYLDLAAWFRRIASQFESPAEQRNIRYSIRAPETLWAEADPEMLERVFINLLSNAFKFTPQGGQIDAELVSLADALQLRVIDTGPGINADQHKVIFERFRQAQGSATRQHGGTGLGLAIVQEFVNLHHGRIEVDSAPGHGATFTVSLPTRAPANTEVKAAPATLGTTTQVALESALLELRPESLASGERPDLPHAPGRPTVLVVEDNREMSSFIGETLHPLFNIVNAYDGYDGMQRAFALQPDLIITDIMMPRMSGDQLVGVIRSRKDLDAVPILLLSAKADDELRVRLLENGAQDYLTKPFLPQELRARVANMVALKRAGDALRTALAVSMGDVESLAKELALKHRQLSAALEANIVAREHAERASEVKTQFLALISHELRTPLSTLHITGSLLLRESDEQHLASIRPRVERLMRATEQMHAVVESLLEYTRVESGRIQLNLKPIRAVEIAEDLIKAQLDRTPPEVALSLDIRQPTTALFDSDPRLVRVILSNLLTNALKFTERGEVVLRLSTDGDRQIFEVHDTGMGIPHDDLERIFLPFEQLEPVQRKSIPGVGLGLALVKQLVEALNGTLEVQSTVKVGSIFKVSFPSGPARSDGEGGSR